jgi:CBS domain-containing protein
MFAGSNLVVFNGLNIDIAMVSLEKRTTGLAGVVSEYNTLVGHEAIFGLFCLKGNITIIGRSWHPRVDVGGILKKLGGGGHQGAGSANLKKSSLLQAKKELVAVLKQDPPIPIKISSIMTEKLVTLEHDLTIDKADIIFGEKKLRGAPVVQDSEIKGILSIKDIKKARLKNSVHLPVTAFMSQNVIEIESDLPVLRAFEKMSEHTIGRLVVVKNKKPVGIISRTDILNMVYGNG